jgi:hypothetical protein
MFDGGRATQKQVPHSREVWVGITYVGATSSSNPTDDSKISELAEKLRDMLQSRRLGGNLSREEFAFVSMMSWFA